MALKKGALLSTILLIVANVFIPIGLITFGIGFFPYKPMLPGLAEFESLESYKTIPDPPFDKLIFVVVDALRSDFVFSERSGFKYTQSLIRDGSAIPFTANARSPTVTMPRLKAITTGSIPSFVDLILNFDEEDTSSTLAAQDTWLAQFKARNSGKLLLYGDDTWLKLFPDTFDRADGTSSFFVADFTEVDHNVTRHLSGELESTDWGLMVLHYLGLDHIGHKSGPRSVNMLPKQEEMDGVIKTIFHAMKSKQHLQSTLLVVCGDHGMNDAGNHGASSPGETSPAIVFMSPKLREISPKFPAPTLPGNEFDYYTTVEQSDLVPTIASLLGFPVSKNNLGAFISEFLPFWSTFEDRKQIMTRNALQILNIITATFGPDLFEVNMQTDPCALESTDVHRLACQWRKLQLGTRTATSTNAEEEEAWIADMSAWLRDAQEVVSSMASDYNMQYLVLGQGAVALSVMASIGAVLLTGISRSTTASIFGSMTVMYGIMMFASSYVEEEQHFWYWFCTIWFLRLGARESPKAGNALRLSWILTLLILLRLVRGWNQTGQKFAGAPDIVRDFVLPHPQMLWLIVAGTYVAESLQILPNVEGLPFVAVTGLTSVLVSSAFTFKLAFTAEDAPELVVGIINAVNEQFRGQSLLSRARIVFSLISALSTFGIYRALSGNYRAKISTREISFSGHKQQAATINLLTLFTAHLLHHLYAIFGMTQTRTTNIPLFSLSSLLFQILQDIDLSMVEISTTSILLQYVSFFASGGSNAISSIDLSNAYNGIGGFNVAAVGFLTFVSNWALPIYWTSVTNLLLLRRWRAGEAAVLQKHLGLLTLFTTTSLAFVMVACTTLRTHLFIWTVFSPKYLYAVAWNLGQHLLINVGFGSFLFWLGAR